MIKCPNCGAELPDDAVFCSACGTRITPVQAGPGTDRKAGPAPQQNGGYQYSQQGPQNRSYGQAGSAPQQSGGYQYSQQGPQNRGYSQGGPAPQQNGGYQYGQQGPRNRSYGQQGPMNNAYHRRPNPGYGYGNAGSGKPVSFDAFAGIVSSDPLSILTLAGAFLCLLSLLFLKWGKVSFILTVSFSLWQAGAGSVILDILMILVVLCIVALRFDILRFPLVEELKSKPYSEFYFPGVLLILFIVVSIIFKSAGSNEYGIGVGFAAGWVLSLIGILAIIADSVMEFVKHQNGTLQRR